MPRLAFATVASHVKADRRQAPAIIGFVLGLLGLPMALGLPALLSSENIAISTGREVLIITVAVCFAAFVFALNGRASRLFGVAIAGVVLALVGEVIALALVIFTATLPSDTASPSSSGARFELLDYHFDGSCHWNTCPIGGTVKNSGSGAGTATVLVLVSDTRGTALQPDGHVLARRECDVPTARPGETVSLDCSPQSDELRARLDTQGPVWIHSRVIANH